MLQWATKNLISWNRDKYLAGPVVYESERIRHEVRVIGRGIVSSTETERDKDVLDKYVFPRIF